MKEQYYYNHLTSEILKLSEEDPEIVSETRSPYFDSPEEAFAHQKQAIYDEMKRIDKLAQEKESEIAHLLSRKDEVYIFLYKKEKK